MSNKKRAYYVKEGHEIHLGKGRDKDGNKIVEVYHCGKIYPQQTKPEDKIKFISAGNRIYLTHEELINKKYWRDVYISNSVEFEDMRKMLRRAKIEGRKETLMQKAGQLGLPRGDEIVEKYLENN